MRRMRKTRKTNLTIAKMNDEPHRCPFCGGYAEIKLNTPDFGKHGAWVQCISCGAMTKVNSITTTIFENDCMRTPVTPSQIFKGVTDAVNAWNSRI